MGYLITSFDNEIVPGFSLMNYPNPFTGPFISTFIPGAS
jgi:hypothetical protein